ncbi:MAG TPA: tyrosine/phenylalanine carboxypeptidase domain-containing protein [Candidatus Saccharimonadales bacterium]|jgi:hypothetical protein
MFEVKSTVGEPGHAEAIERFMALNIEQYGAPDRQTFVSLLSDRLDSIEQKNLHGTALALYEELLATLPPEFVAEGKTPERFKPSAETMDWMHTAVTTLYEPLLAHVPDKDKFTRQEVQGILTEILEDEFGKSAADWRVDIEPAKSLNVKTPEKRIVIPEGTTLISREVLRKRIVHEIGVHVMRLITGEQADIMPLQTGLDAYYDTEEGLGMIMEQALNGKYGEAGVGHYFTAGLAFFGGLDFRQTYEYKWRIGALTDLKASEALTDSAITEAKGAAYNAVMRMFRGTDEAPWFKDLAYFNGSADTWKFLESIQGDNDRLTLLLMGKVNTSPAHLSTILESRTV